MWSNEQRIASIRQALSAARMQTYEAAMQIRGADDEAALQLYVWNALVSAQLLAPLHVCEVVIRNAVADALSGVYGDNWPWSASFERSLPDTGKGYSPRRDLQQARQQAQNTGKVIPELKLAFWQRMFTGRHDERLWNTHLLRVLPNLDGGQPVSLLRSDIYADLEKLRQLRNRIAHHEPVFRRNLQADYLCMLALVRLRCSITADWLQRSQPMDSLLCSKPQPVT